MTIRCYDGFCMVSGHAAGEAEVNGCVDSRRGCTYFINKAGMLSERYFDDAHRLARNVRPIELDTSLEARYVVGEAVHPTALLRAEGLIFVGYSSGVVATVNASTFEAAEKNKRHAKAVVCAAAFAENVYTCDAAGAVYRWSAASGDYVDYYPCSFTEQVAVVKCMVAHEGVLAVGGVGGLLCLDLLDNMGRLLWYPLDDEESAVTAVAFTPTALWAGDDRGVLRLLDLSTGLLLRKIESTHSSKILQLVNVGGTVWSSAADRVLAVSDAATGALVEKKRTEDESSVVTILPIGEASSINVWVTTTSGAMSMWKGSIPAKKADASEQPPESPVGSPTGIFNGVAKDLAERDLSYLVPSHARTLLRMAGEGEKGGRGGGAPPKMVSDLNRFREVQTKLMRSNELQEGRIKALEMELEMTKNRELRQNKERDNRIEVLEETQARNLDLLRKREDRIEELEKMLAIAQAQPISISPPRSVPRSTPRRSPRRRARDAIDSPAGPTSDTPDVHIANPPQYRLVSPLEGPSAAPHSPPRMSSRNESFLVATRKPLITKLLAMRGAFEKAFPALDTVEVEVKKAVPEDDGVRGYLVEGSLAELQRMLREVQQDWDAVCDQYLLAREKEAYRIGAWRSGQPLVPPGTAGTRGRARSQGRGAGSQPPTPTPSRAGRAASRASDRSGAAVVRAHSAGSRYRRVEAMPVLHNKRDGARRASRALTPPPCARPDAVSQPPARSPNPRRPVKAAAPQRQRAAGAGAGVDLRKAMGRAQPEPSAIPAA